MDVVDAEDLWLLTEVDKYGYICRGCELTVYPASYLKTNLQRPHFRSPHGKKHMQGCDIEGDEKAVASGKKGSVRNKLETSSALSPARLVLRDERPIVDPIASPLSSGATRSGGTGSSGNGEARPQGRRSAQSIRRICRAFINFPYDRDLSLEIPGVEATTYQHVFKKLRGKGIEHLPSQKIFYGELSWARAEDDEDNLLITLSAGEWGTDAKRYVQPYKVQISWADWSNAKRTMVTNELEVVRQEGIDAKKDGSKDRPYIFFLGHQDEGDPSIFHVDDHRLICGLLATMTYPPRG
ncbi:MULTISPECIES: hypothetical protein [Pseudomonas syringae group]|nr:MULTISPECIES: hypothetical protein [Pseudomonas syringae group]MDU8459100.1 hypothetical protein [Pseudomonas syringae group sp. J254-4]MDU8544709.1 hypothetical protein [Pseudomonas syringae group sp. J248-6]